MSTIYLKAAGFVERLCADGRDVTITDADVADRLRRGGAVETPARCGSRWRSLLIGEIFDICGRVGRARNLAVLGPLGVAARTAATVGDAFTIVETFLGLYRPANSAHTPELRGTSERHFACALSVHHILDAIRPKLCECRVITAANVDDGPHRRDSSRHCEHAPGRA